LIFALTRQLFAYLPRQHRLIFFLYLTWLADALGGLSLAVHREQDRIGAVSLMGSSLTCCRRNPKCSVQKLFLWCRIGNVYGNLRRFLFFLLLSKLDIRGPAGHRITQDHRVVEILCNRRVQYRCEFLVTGRAIRMKARSCKEGVTNIKRFPILQCIFPVPIMKLKNIQTPTRLRHQLTTEAQSPYLRFRWRFSN
jgi:hypothetical protein